MVSTTSEYHSNLNKPLQKKDKLEKLLSMKYYKTNTHLTSSFSRTTWVSRHQKGENHSVF